MFITINAVRKLIEVVIIQVNAVMMSNSVSIVPDSSKGIYEKSVQSLTFLNTSDYEMFSFILIKLINTLTHSTSKYHLRLIHWVFRPICA